MKKSQLWSWGGNFCGQLGHGDEIPKEFPWLISDTHFNKNTIKSIFSGDQGCFAVSFNNNIYSWGDNSKNQIMQPNNEHYLIPTVVGKEKLEIVTKVEN